MTLWDSIKNIFKKQSQLPKEVREYNVKSYTEEQLKRDEDAKKRRIEEREYRERIYNLWNASGSYRDYLEESRKFNKIYGKNVKCDICGWNCGLDVDLYNYNGQTYCEQHIPASSQLEHERKIIAGRHGSARDFIKK